MSAAKRSAGKRGRPAVIAHRDHLAIAALVQSWRDRGYPLISKVRGPPYHRAGACYLVELQLSRARAPWQLAPLIGTEQIKKIYLANRLKLPSDPIERLDLPRDFMSRLRKRGVRGWNPFGRGEQIPTPNMRTHRRHRAALQLADAERPPLARLRWYPPDGCWCKDGYDA